jgi:hypothetical protein
MSLLIVPLEICTENFCHSMCCVAKRAAAETLIFRRVLHGELPFSLLKVDTPGLCHLATAGC